MSAMVAEGVVSEMAVQQLGAKSIHSAEDLLFFTCSNFHDVASRTGISVDELERIVKGVSRKLGSLPQCASEVFQVWKENCVQLGTGSEALDELLTGGVFTGELTEFVGPCAAGKTQVCLALALQTCRSEKQTVAFLDTGTSFPPSRVKEMAKAQHRAACMRRRAHLNLHAQDDGLRSQMEEVEEEADEDEDEETWDAPLQRLRVYRVANADALLWELTELEQQLCDGSDRFFANLKLIVIDSLGTAFAPLIGGGTHFGHSLLVSVVQTLQRLSAQYNVSVVVTNHTTSGFNHLHQHQPALGDTWSHLPCVSVSISFVDGDMTTSRRRAQVRKSNKNHTLAVADFCLCAAGVADEMSPVRA